VEHHALGLGLGAVFGRGGDLGLEAAGAQGAAERDERVQVALRSDGGENDANEATPTG
jgi:hypothetical protein